MGQTHSTESGPRRPPPGAASLGTFARDRVTSRMYLNPWRRRLQAPLRMPLCQAGFNVKSCTPYTKKGSIRVMQCSGPTPQAFPVFPASDPIMACKSHMSLAWKSWSRLNLLLSFPLLLPSFFFLFTQVGRETPPREGESAGKVMLLPPLRPLLIMPRCFFC